MREHVGMGDLSRQRREQFFEPERLILTDQAAKAWEPR
jgi:hypothetical protein